MIKLYTGVKSRLHCLRSEKGNAAEYGLIVALIAVAIILGATLLGGSLNTMFTNIGNKLTGVVVP